ncbi:hypothetical protein V8D89_005222 [Ganoderma adspersum]
MAILSFLSEFSPPAPVFPPPPPFPLTSIPFSLSDLSSDSDTRPTIDMSKIPDWLLTHPELRKRGITLHTPLQPFTVYATERRPEGPVHVVKAIKPSGPEADIYDLLDQHSDSPNDHTIPHELIRCERPLVVMLFASALDDFCTKYTSSILAAFDQILEGVEHMHRLRITHGDIYAYNVVAARAEDAAHDARLTVGRVYLIDFKSCRQFEHGPGVQTAVPLPHTHVVPPLGMKSFDPFSWDVYCLGRTLEVMTEDTFMTLGIRRMMWRNGIPHLFARWLKGNEAGCY